MYLNACLQYINIRREEQEERYEEKNKKRVTRRNDQKTIKNKKIKKVRKYGRNVYISFDPKWIKKGLTPSKNPSKWRTYHNTTNSLKNKKR